MLKIILIFAELERNMTSERVTGIMLDRAENGLWNGGLPPLGYKTDPEKQILIPEPEEKDRVKMIFDLYEKFHSCRKVARFLQQNGVKPKYHTEWLPEHIPIHSDFGFSAPWNSQRLYVYVPMYNSFRSVRRMYSGSHSV